MARVIGGIGHTVLSLSVLAVLTGCGGGPGVTQNALPSGSSGSSGTGSSGGNANPGPSTGGSGTTTPGGSTGTTTPPPVNQAIGDPATATANSSVLTTTRTDTYNINAAALGTSGWRPTALMENETRYEVRDGANSPRVAFDAAGNGLAVWALGDIYVSRYTASTASWSAPVVIDEGIDQAHQPRLSIDRTTGNAIVTFTQSDGVAESIYATRYTASTGAWSAPQVLENSNNAVDGAAENSNLHVNGSHAAAAWRQSDGTNVNVYLSRLESGVWSAPLLIDTGTNPALHPDVVVDSSGNVTVAWRQNDPVTGYRINTRRWDNATQTLGPVMPMNGNGERQHRLGIDPSGNVFLVWRNGGVFFRYYDAATGTWTAQTDLSAGVGGTVDAELSVDAAGNALVAWIENASSIPSIYARRYSATTHTWGNAELVETSTVPVNPDTFITASMSGNEAVVAWISSANDVYASKMNNGVWGPMTLLENRAEAGNELTSAINAAGNAAVLWQQADGAQRSIYQAMYQTANFIVPAGATWQSIANSLYGVNNAEAGTALQTAMGGGALTTGAILSGFPATLTVTTPIPGYYTVLSTDTWAHVAQRVYGVTDAAAIARLQQLVGTTTLTTGAHLVVPSSFVYTESANFRAPLDWTRVNTTSTTYHQLNNSVLTTPLTNWSTQVLLETDPNEAFNPRVAFDNAGNGVATWLQAGNIYVSRYTISNGQWSTATAVDIGTTPAYSPKVTVDRVTGDAFVSFSQSDGVAVSMYVTSLTASTNTWSVPQLLETSNLAVTDSSEQTASARRGAHAVIAWLQSDGTAMHLYMSRLVAGTWAAPQRVDTGNDYGVGDHPEVQVDDNGNAILVWRQRDAATGFRINARRWDNTTQAFGAVVPLNINGVGDRHARISMDTAGNAIAVWRGGGAYARRYDVTTGTWGPQIQLNVGGGAGTTAEVSVDTNGDALATWVETDSTGPSQYARHYTASTNTWGSAVALENSSEAVNIDIETTVAFVNGKGIVAWPQANGQLYAARYANGVWGAAVNIENRAEAATVTVAAMDGNANATVLWIQADGVRRSIYGARSTSVPYYSVPAGATWQSLANTLYGIDSVPAASALQTAMSNVTLTTGLHLQPLPTTLTVTPPTPTNYVVQTGDTWQSITLALYGTNRSEAATALWDYLGRPTLTVGQQLLIPAELAYTIAQ
jgi:LysM repeat protein